ncbi:MAG: 4-alpha-glucanotransferase, partial [Actinomycetota bacterium]
MPLTAVEPSPLATLARMWAIQGSYRDVEGKLRRGSRRAVLAILSALGAPVGAEGATGDDIAGAIVARQRQLWERPVEPVIVAWDGRLHALSVRLPEASASGPFQLRLETEDGEVETLRPEGSATWGSPGEVDGQRFVELRLQLERAVPLGYHRLVVEPAGNGTPAVAMVIAAPRRAVAASHRLWGVFSPLYALRADRASALGIGDVADLQALLEWTESLGGSLVATLPLLPTFLDEVFEPSPYSPVSRQFWNEIYVDLGAVPEVAESPAARQALAEARRDLEEAGVLSGRLCDYRRVAKAKRRVLAAAADQLLEGGSERQEALRRFAENNPDLEPYAAFRAAGEHYGCPWPQWPEPARDGKLTFDDAPETARCYHRYVQFLASSQIGAVAGGSEAALLFDLPLGGHPAGFDVWYHRDQFLTELCTGAPPDPMNLHGQNWGNPPANPDRIREGGYGYFLACLRHLLAHSGVLRIDHVPGLHRMFVLPRSGTEPGDGAYLRSRPEELYALLCLESHRARGGRGAVIVGEDLGTVPGYVRTEMARHGVYRSYVAQFGIDTGSGRTPDAHLMAGSVAGGASLQRPPANSFASLNTHDVAPFAAFWQGTDIA